MEIEKKLSSFDQQIAVDQKFIQRVSWLYTSYHYGITFLSQMLGGSSTYEDDSFYTDEGLM